MKAIALIAAGVLIGGAYVRWRVSQPDPVDAEAQDGITLLEIYLSEMSRD